jgi:hypothetical protein
MRMFLKVQMEVEAANRAIKDGSLPRIVENFIDAAQPEGVWFTALDGKRTMVAVFDLTSTANIPPLAEPFFAALNATFEMSPAMDAADLGAGHPKQSLGLCRRPKALPPTRRVINESHDWLCPTRAVGTGRSGSL